MKIISLFLTIFVMPSCLFADIVTFTELNESDPNKHLSTSMIEIPVDIHGIIEVRFNIYDISELLPSSQPPVNPVLEKDMEKTHDILKAIESDLETYIKDVMPLRQKILNGDKSEKTANLLKERVKIHYSLITSLKEYARLYLTDDEQTKISQNPKTRVANYMNVLKKQIDTQQTTMDEQLRQFLDSQKVNISAWCVHKRAGRQAEYINLENYHNVQMEEREPTPNVSFVRTEEQEKELQQSRQLNNSIMTTVKNITRQVQSYETLKQQLDTYFSSATTQLKQIPNPGQTISSLVSLLSSLESGPEVNSIRAPIEEIKGLTEDARVSVQNIQKSVENSTVNSTDEVESLTQILKTLDNEVKTLRSHYTDDLVKKIEVKLEFINKESNKLGNRMEESTKQLLLSYVGDLKKSFDVLITSQNILTNIAANIKEIKSGIEETLTLIKMIKTVKSDIEPNLGKPSDALERAASEAKDTCIDINSTAWEENDLYILNVEIGKDKNVLKNKTYRFRAKRYGWYNRWSDSIAFSKGSWSDNVQPSAAVAWNLHHRSRPKEKKGEIKGGKNLLGDVINLGIGLNSMMFSTDKNVEVGLGIDVSLFNGMLHAGYGINFQQYPRPGYCYVAASLFNIFGQHQNKQK